ncbi:MAG: acetate kinase [Actinomycetota bacterium]
MRRPIDRVLVLNAGSSSVKYQLIGLADDDVGGDLDGETLAGGVIEEVSDRHAAFEQIAGALAGQRVDAIGHRVVHGGDVFSAPVLIDDTVVDALRSLVPLAPLHNPANIDGIEIARRVWPDDPQVAVFDTAFHATLPPHAFRYAVPEAWYREHGVRRYGFHGTSHAYVARRAAVVLGRPLDDLALITAHLGNGASMAAIHGGRSIDTSMGLSPLEGLVMGTRSGDIDPTVVAHVAAASGRSADDVIGELNEVSGLRGLCADSDMREILERRAAGDGDAALAFDVFVYRIRKYVGAYLAALGRCDALVFTGGIGEHSHDVRAAVCAGVEHLGFAIDDERNRHSDVIASVEHAERAVLVVPTDEEHSIAEQTAALLA